MPVRPPQARRSRGSFREIEGGMLAMINCRRRVATLLEVLATAGLLSVQMEELHGIAGQHCVLLLFRHPGELLLHQVS